jgi:hypothetical protein
MMVAAHNNDLKAAKAQGTDLAPDPACVDVAARDFVDLGAKLGA